MPQAEFDGLLNALEYRDPIVPSPEEGAKGRTDLNPLPDLSVEERIRTLKVPKNAINAGDKVERGRSIARQLLENYGTTVKSRIMRSPLAGMGIRHSSD
jgi:hypothetical protein